MNYHIYAEGMIDSLKAENAALREQLAAEREKRAALVKFWRSIPFTSEYTVGIRDAADQLAALDKPEGA